MKWGITSVAHGEWSVLTRLCEGKFAAIPPYLCELVISRHVCDSGYNPFRKSGYAFAAYTS
jgi:hypothetical protein